MPHLVPWGTPVIYIRPDRVGQRRDSYPTSPLRDHYTLLYNVLQRNDQIHYPLGTEGRVRRAAQQRKSLEQKSYCIAYYLVFPLKSSIPSII